MITGIVSLIVSLIAGYAGTAGGIALIGGMMGKVGLSSAAAPAVAKVLANAPNPVSLVKNVEKFCDLTNFPLTDAEHQVITALRNNPKTPDVGGPMA